MAVKSAKDVNIQATNNVIVVRNLFLWCMAAVYFFAFGSLYYQIPGLYGDNGILPARLALKPVGKTLEEKFASQPTLAWLAPTFGLDVQHMVELIALAGVLISFAALLVRPLRTAVTYATLWVLYMSLYQVGQTFTWFQWDSLLLEAGFLTVLVAPLRLLRWTLGGAGGPHVRITLWLVRWLLFRLMFASGVVKLTSMCPTWWQLTALDYHFESQCLPTPLAWYAHHLPNWTLKLGVVGTYVIEIVTPFLFFAPLRSLRLFGFCSQLLLQVMILLTGNYNFFNLLTIVLCVPLLDDNNLTRAARSQDRKRQTSRFATVLRFSSYLLEFGTYCALVHCTVTAFSIRVNPDWTIHSKIAFTSQQFNRALEKALLVSVYVGALSLSATVVGAVHRALTDVQGLLGKVVSLCTCLSYAAVAFWIFCISMVPHTVILKDVHSSVWPVVRKWHDHVDAYQLVNSYGLFRRMTGVGGRPEVVIEGSDSSNGPWKEYHFAYKPGNSLTPLPIAAPHQPRLDWQMWFAALDSYQQHPWFVSLVHRLLNGQPEVLDLLDRKRNPFPVQPPKYVHAVSYLYSYTPWSDWKSREWWTRKKVGEYLPALTKDHPSLKEYLQRNHLVQTQKSERVTNVLLQRLLQETRSWIGRVSAPVFLWTAFVPALTFALFL